MYVVRVYIYMIISICIIFYIFTCINIMCINMSLPIYDILFQSLPQAEAQACSASSPLEPSRKPLPRPRRRTFRMLKGTFLHAAMAFVEPLLQSVLSPVLYMQLL